MSKKTITLTESQLRDVIRESVENILHENSLITEMAMPAAKMSDKYGEVVSSIIDNMACICLYPNNQAVTHWRNRVPALCKRFIDLDIDPLSNNTPDYRYTVLMNGVIETLNENYGAILNHFKTVATYYASRPKPDTIRPIKDYNICYQENAERMEHGIKEITKFVANQDIVSLTDFIETF